MSAVALGARDAWRRPLLPVGQVAGFCLLFLLLSLAAAVPLSLLTGRRVLGIGYILPFTLVFVVGYQKLVHGEGLTELGLDARAPYVRLVAAGFFGSGLGALGIQAVQLQVGWMDVRSINALALGPEALAAGLGLALALNLGIGVGEELIYRGYVLRRLLVGYGGRTPGIVISAAVFSGSHLPKSRDVLTLFNLFLLGAVLALAVVVTRSLWSSIGIHMGWDFWSSGVYVFAPPGRRASRLVTYSYHLKGWNDLLAFKMVAALTLALAAAWLLWHLRSRAQDQERTEEVGWRPSWRSPGTLWP